MSLTVTEQAIIDLERQREAITARAKNFDPTAIGRREPGDTIMPPDYVDALARPVRQEHHQDCGRGAGPDERQDADQPQAARRSQQFLITVNPLNVVLSALIAPIYIIR
jgi:hypothetical protein